MTLRDDPVFAREVGDIFRDYPDVFGSERTYYRYWSELDFSPFIWRLLCAPRLMWRIVRAQARAQERQRTRTAVYDTTP